MSGARPGIRSRVRIHGRGVGGRVRDPSAVGLGGWLALAALLTAVALGSGAVARADLTPEDEAMLEIADLLWDLEMLEQMEPEELDDVLFDPETIVPEPKPGTPAKEDQK